MVENMHQSLERIFHLSARFPYQTDDNAFRCTGRPRGCYQMYKIRCQLVKGLLSEMYLKIACFRKQTEPLINSVLGAIAFSVHWLSESFLQMSDCRKNRCGIWQHYPYIDKQFSAISELCKMLSAHLLFWLIDERATRFCSESGKIVSDRRLFSVTADHNCHPSQLSTLLR